MLLLRHTCFHGRLYSESSIIAGLNSVIGTSESRDPIDTTLLPRAFKDKLAGSGGHYVLKCSKILEYGPGYTPASNNLYVHFHGDHGREVAIGRFKSEEAGNKATGTIHEWCIIPDTERDELIQYLDERKQEASRKGGAKKAGSKKRRNSRQQTPRANVTPNPGTPSSHSMSGVQLSPPRKKQATTVNNDAERLIEAFTESEKVLPWEPSVH